MKHQNRIERSEGENKIKRNAIKEFKFDDDPKMRPIVEPEEFNVQYTPQTFILENEKQYKTVVHEKNEMGLGGEEVEYENKDNQQMKGEEVDSQENIRLSGGDEEDIQKSQAYFSKEEANDKARILSKLI